MDADRRQPLRASFFSAEAAVGQPLAGLHAPVPGFNEDLLPRVARIFDNLAVDQVLERRNWTLVNDPALFQPDPAPFRARLAGQTTDQIAASLHIRRERQTLRRAPQTGAVLFTIRIWTEPLDDLLADPQRRAGFAQAWDKVMGDDGAPFRTYKRLDLYDAAVRHRACQHGIGVVCQGARRDYGRAQLILGDRPLMVRHARRHSRARHPDGFAGFSTGSYLSGSGDLAPGRQARFGR